MKTDKKISKTTTEPIKLADIWDNFKADYKPFVEWLVDADNLSHTFIIVEFISDAPELYKNKWGRDQYKMEVYQSTEEKILSGGKRLFLQLKKLCLSENCKPSELGNVLIIRQGSGFDTNYSVELSTSS